MAIFDRLTHSIKLVLRYRLVLYFVIFSFVSGFIIYPSIFGCDVLKTWFVFILHAFHSLRAQCPRTASKVKKSVSQCFTFYIGSTNDLLLKWLVPSAEILHEMRVHGPSVHVVDLTIQLVAQAMIVGQDLMLK